MVNFVFLYRFKEAGEGKKEKVMSYCRGIGQNKTRIILHSLSVTQNFFAAFKNPTSHGNPVDQMCAGGRGSKRESESATTGSAILLCFGAQLFVCVPTQDS